MKQNLTSENVLKSVVFFSAPYLLSYFLQTLYGMADLFIIGQFGSVADITSVSIGSQVMHMITVMIVGLAMGTTVSVGKSIGAKNSDDAAKAIGNTVTCFISLSIAAAVILLAFIKPITALMSTPTEAVNGTISYLTICIIGIPFITAYNIISSIFRGLGDSKSPMYFIAAACVINIVLDYIFMGIFDMGPAGAALGTTLSQTFSVIIALVYISKKDVGIKLKKDDFKPKKSIILPIIKVGIPVALQDGFIQISFLVITIIANKRGLNDAAAVGIVEKLIGIFFLVPSSMLSSVSALAAQNIGAGKPQRAKLTLKYAVIFAVGFGLVISVVSQFCSEQLIGIFEDDINVMRLGGQYLRSYVWDCAFAGISFCFSGYFCALERSGISFMHNVMSILLVRVPVAYTMSNRFPTSLYPMGLASPLGSLLSSVICITAYIIIGKNTSRIKSRTA